MNGDVILVLLVSPQVFVDRMGTFLLTLSQALRASVSLKVKDGKPQIFEWDSVKGVGEQVEIPKEYMAEISSSHIRTRRESKIFLLIARKRLVYVYKRRPSLLVVLFVRFPLLLLSFTVFR